MVVVVVVVVVGKSPACRKSRGYDNNLLVLQTIKEARAFMRFFT
jgi:hypothetical protein